ncbi:MAG: hypothetical protein QF893_22570 [Alphaproteobacteria bacterium]|jgi:hypothetical protein|nr:hypothetical protein [Alphaproteobacteria bacterium]
MSLGNILVAKGLVSKDGLRRAYDTLEESGGRLTDCLVALGLVSRDAVEQVEAEVPVAPGNLQETGNDPVFLLQLMAKGMYMENLETPSQVAGAMKLPSSIVNTLLKDAVDRKLVETLGQTDAGLGALAEMRYVLSRGGRDWASESMDKCQYFGPAPVSLDAYQERVLRQRITNEEVSQDRLDKAFEGLTIPERFLDRLGPAISSGTAILIYGAAGNGKTSIAQLAGHIFEDVVYIPHCFEVDGQIVKVFDPSLHRPIDEAGDGRRGLRRERLDDRWVPCYRPMVMTAAS